MEFYFDLGTAGDGLLGDWAVTLHWELSGQKRQKRKLPWLHEWKELHTCDAAVLTGHPSLWVHMAWVVLYGLVVQWSSRAVLSNWCFGDPLWSSGCDEGPHPHCGEGHAIQWLQWKDKLNECNKLLERRNSFEMSHKSGIISFMPVRQYGAR